MNLELNSGQVFAALSTLSETRQTINVDTNDATVTEADFAEIEAYANGLVTV